MAKSEIIKEVVVNSTVNSVKAFRASDEVENLYRFIYENKLRSEAKILMGVVVKAITPVKKRGRKKIVH